jgi:hypothetical protein
MHVVQPHDAPLDLRTQRVRNDGVCVHWHHEITDAVQRHLHAQPIRARQHGEQRDDQQPAQHGGE